MVAERNQLLSLGYSRHVINTLLASRRDFMNRIYDVTWKTFCKWSQTRSLDPMFPSVEVVLEFLQSGLDSGLRPATLRRQVAALNSVLQHSMKVNLSTHHHIVQFLKGVSILSPPQIHRFPTWKLNMVLNALTDSPFKPIRDILLKLLRMKTIFLVAITSAQRVSEIGALSADPKLCIFHKDKVVLRLDPSFMPKVALRFHVAQKLSLLSFCVNPTHPMDRRWDALDVRWVLKTYLTRTESLRKSDSLFINIAEPNKGKKKSSSSISFAIRSCIALAYKAAKIPAPAGITVHSIRCAAANATFARGASVEVCRAATWSGLPFRHS